MESQNFPSICHQPVTHKLDELLKVTTRLETEVQSVGKRLTKIEDKFDKSAEENSKSKTTISHLVAFANNNKDNHRNIEKISHRVLNIENESDSRKSKFKKVIENVYQICLIILTIMLPIVLAKIGLAQ